jgi:hypothetical protein
MQRSLCFKWFNLQNGILILISRSLNYCWPKEPVAFYSINILIKFWILLSIIDQVLFKWVPRDVFYVQTSEIQNKYLIFSHVRNFFHWKRIVAYLLHARTVEPQKQPSLSNTRTQQSNTGVMQPASRQRFAKHPSAQAQWRHTPTKFSYQVTCCLCGLHYATVKQCFLPCPCRGYKTRDRLQLKRVQDRF